MAGISALHFCIFRGNNDEAINLIEAGKSDLNAGDVGGQTPTHIACYRDNISVVKKLVEAGADPSKADKSGNTPMHAAAGEGAVAVVKYFIEQGVPATKNEEGFTPLELARRHCPPRARSAMLGMLEGYATVQADEEKKKLEEEESRLRRKIKQEKQQLQKQQQQLQEQQLQPRFLHTLPPAPLQPQSPTSTAGDSSVVSGMEGRGRRRPQSIKSTSTGNGTKKNMRNGSRSRNSSSSSSSHAAAADRSPEEVQALRSAGASNDPHLRTLYKMLMRQHGSINALTEVVKTQADTISGLVSMLGRSGVTPVATATATATEGHTPGRQLGNGECVDDEDAIAEMVAYLDGSQTPGSVVDGSAATATEKL